MGIRETSLERGAASRFPVLALLHPRQHTRAVMLTLAIGVALWALLVRFAGTPIWVASALVVALLLLPGARKWIDDRRRYGPTVMVLSILLAAQGFHSIEHTVQVIQFHILKWPPFASSGLISAANAEWVHFVWNWAVVAATLYLLRGGMRNVWAWLLLAWVVAHALEHAYMLARYLEMVQALQRLGFPSLSAQGLPGVLGRDGWLARSAATQGTFLCRLPGVTTAPRIDIHFWWNAGEIVLLLIAAHTFLRARTFPQNASTLPGG